MALCLGGGGYESSPEQIRDHEMRIEREESYFHRGSRIGMYLGLAIGAYSLASESSPQDLSVSVDYCKNLIFLPMSAFAGFVGGAHVSRAVSGLVDLLKRG